MADVTDSGVTESNILGDRPSFGDESEGVDDSNALVPVVEEPGGETEGLEAVDDLSVAEFDGEQAGALSGGDYFTDAEEAFALTETSSSPNQPTGNDTEEPSEDDLKGASPRMQTRLRSLVSRLRDTGEKNQQLEQWAGSARQEYQQLQSRAQQVANENQQLRVQFAGMSARLESIEKYGTQTAQQQPEDPATEFQKETIQKSLEQVGAGVNPALKSLQGEINGLKGELAKRDQAVKSTQRREFLNTKADDALDSTIFPEGYPDEIKEDVADVLGALVLAHSYGTNKRIQDAASDLDRVFRQHGLGLLRARASRKGGKVSKSQRTASTAPRSSSAGNGKGKVVSSAQAKQAGFKDSLDMAMAKDGLGRG